MCGGAEEKRNPAFCLYLVLSQGAQRNTSLCSQEISQVASSGYSLISGCYFPSSCLYLILAEDAQGNSSLCTLVWSGYVWIVQP